MTDEIESDMRTEGYWERVNDATRTTADMIEEAIREADEPEQILSLSITGEEDGTIFALAHSIKERDGHEILTLRYVTWPE